VWTEHVGHSQISEAAGAGKGRALEEGFACAGAEGGWCCCVRGSPVFVELVVQGLAPRQSKGQGESGQQRPEVISVSCTLMFNDPIAEGNLRGPDIQRQYLLKAEWGRKANSHSLLSAQPSPYVICASFLYVILEKLLLLYCLQSVFSSLFSFPPAPAVLSSPPRCASAVQLQLSPANHS